MISLRWTKCLNVMTCLANNDVVISGKCFTKKNFVNTINVGRKASTFSLIENNLFLSYCKFLKDLHTKLENGSLNPLESFSYPELLLKELGGKPTMFAMHKLSHIIAIEQDIESSMSYLNDLVNLHGEKDIEEDMRALVSEEKSSVIQHIENLKCNVVNQLISDPDVESCEGVLMEVVPGVGGAEASLFAMELYEMYCRYLDSQSVSLDLMICDKTEFGGLHRGSLIISSGHLYNLLRHECGTHRVQRVPETENRGRVHTSTATVSVIPKLSATVNSLDPKDIKKFFSKSTKKGGQHVNKTMSQAHVVHIPTNISVMCQDTRSQVDNLETALLQLTYKVQKMQQDAVKRKMNDARQMHLRSRERSDKIRTYNYPQDRITDHRIGCTIKGIDMFFAGSSSFEGLLAMLDVDWTNSQKCSVLHSLMQEAGILS